MELMVELIHRVIGLPMKGYKVPMDMPSAAIIQEHLGSEEEGTNSKGIQIGQACYDSIKWTLTIIAVCLMNAG